MNEAEIQQVIASVTARGREMTRYDALTFLGAKELLAKSPKHEIAKEVVEDYSRYILTGERIKNFGQFLLPIPETNGEKAETDWYAKAFPEEEVSRCQ